MQFKLKKKSGGPLFTGGIKTELKHINFNKNTHLNSVSYQIQMQEYKSIFEKKNRNTCVHVVYI